MKLLSRFQCKRHFSAKPRLTSEETSRVHHGSRLNRSFQIPSTHQDLSCPAHHQVMQADHSQGYYSPYHETRVAPSKALSGVTQSEWYLRGYPYSYSQLSPLITYSPSSAWNISLKDAHTTTSGATMSVNFMGSVFIISGTETGASFNSTPPIPPMRRYGSEPNYHLGSGRRYPDEYIFTLMGGDQSLERRNFSLGLQGDEGQLSVRMVQHSTEIPALRE